MPQLDQYSFFTQYFWLFLCFLGFYFLILKSFLPKVAQILKVRISMMEGGLAQDELKRIAFSLNTEKICAGAHEVSGLGSSKDLFTKSFDDTSNWSSKTVQTINKEALGEIHEAYIGTIGQFSLSQNLSLKQLESLLPPSCDNLRSTASINTALNSYPQRELNFDRALFKNLKLRNRDLIKD